MDVVDEGDVGWTAEEEIPQREAGVPVQGGGAGSGGSVHPHQPASSNMLYIRL